jgi:acetyl esterase
MTAGPSDPGILQFLAETAALYPDDAVDFTMAEQRGFYDALCRHFRKARPADVTVEDSLLSTSAAAIPLRHYIPPDPASPRVLYLHGGGFVVGGLDSHDDICAELCSRARVCVTAVHYRLAPEHRFPASFDDCLAVYASLAAQGPVTIAGDSAGGNLAAAIALHARDHGLMAPRGLVLIYPGLGGDRSRGSYVERADAPGLSTRDVAWYAETYLGGGEPAPALRKFAMPLSETDWRGLPPAFLVACEWDPLRDDCFEAAAALAAAGVPSRVRLEPQLVHACLRARHISAPAAALFTAIVEAVAALAYSGRLPH